MKNKMCFKIKYVDAYFDGYTWYSNEEFEIKTVCVESDDEIISILSDLMENRYGYKPGEYEISDCVDTIECLVRSSENTSYFDKPVIYADFVSNEVI